MAHSTAATAHSSNEDHCALKMNGQTEIVAESPPEQSEYISRMRETVIKELERSGHPPGRACDKIDDVNGNIRVIRALLATNAEILDRVVDYVNYDGDDGTVFARFGFEVVRAQQWQQFQTKVRFVTYPETSEMAFDLTPLKTVPACFVLRPVYRTDFTSLVDYELYFERSLGALHRDVLAPFLIGFKSHLESIQVCLGEVDDWLLDAQSNVEFLETTFGLSLETDTYQGSSSEVYASDNGDAFVPGTNRCLVNETCVNCNLGFNWHHCVFMNGRYYRRCIPHNANNGDGSRSFFTYLRQQVLKECEFNGRVEAVFHISQASEQDRLIKLLDFLSC